MDSQHLQPFLHQLGLDPSSDPLTLINELMNLSLQCLGSIRILTEEYERKRKGKYTTTLFHANQWKEEGWGFWSLRKSFKYAVKRYLTHILKADEIHNLDPSRHIVESFPNINTINSSSWLAVHWAILGDPELHSFSEETHQVHRLSHDDSTSDADDINNGSKSKHGVEVVDERILLVDEVSKLIPSTVSEVDKEGRSVLHIAARLDSVDLFQCTLRNTTLHHGKTIQNVNKNGALPLHNTARFCPYPEVFRQVLKEYPEALTFLNIDQMLPLHWAAVKNASVEIVKSLMELHPEGIHSPNSEGYLPLHCAAQNNCLEVVKVIYEAYPQAIQMPDHEGGLPLHHACCFRNNFEVIKFIYDAYPEAIDIPQQDCIAPIHLAASQNNSVEVLKFILEKVPKSAMLKDRVNWVATDCLLSNMEHYSVSVSSLNCLNTLLKASPAVTTVGWLQKRDFVTRLILNHNPKLEPALYRELNWTARKVGLWVMAKLASQAVMGSSGVDSLGEEQSRHCHIMEYKMKYGAKQEHNHGEDLMQYVRSHVRYDKLRAHVLRKLCQHFMAHDVVEIPAGILRIIVKFL